MRVARMLGAAAAAVLAIAAPAAASPPTEGSGAGAVVVRVPTETRTADGNTIQVRETDGVVTGAFDGTFQQVVRGVIHKDGFVTFHGFMTFTGVAGDCGAGTITLEVEGRGFAAGVIEGRLRTIDQASNTIDVHVIGTFQETLTAITYEGQFHCD